MSFGMGNILSEGKQRFKRRVMAAKAVIAFFEMARDRYPRMVWASSESINKHTLRNPTSEHITDALEVMFCSGLFIRSPYTFEWTIDWDKWAKDQTVENWIDKNSVVKERANGYARYKKWLKKFQQRKR